MKKYFTILLTMGTFSAFAADFKMTDLSSTLVVNRDNIKHLVAKKEDLRISCTVDPATKKSLTEAQEKITEAKVRELSDKFKSDTQKLIEQLKSELRTELKSELKPQVINELRESPSIIKQIKEELRPAVSAQIRSELAEAAKKKYPYEDSLNSESLKNIAKFYDLKLIIKEEILFYNDAFEGYMGKHGVIRISSSKDNVRLIAGKTILLNNNYVPFYRFGNYDFLKFETNIIGLTVFLPYFGIHNNSDYTLEQINTMIAEFAFIQPVKRKFSDL